MPNDYIPRPDAQFHACRNNFVTYANGHAAHDRLRRRGQADTQGCSVGAPYPTNGVMGAEIWARVAWASRPRTCDPPPPGWPPQKNAKLGRREGTNRCLSPFIVWDPLDGPRPEALRIRNPAKHLDHAKKEVVAARYYDIPPEAVAAAANAQTNRGGGRDV